MGLPIEKLIVATNENDIFQIKINLILRDFLR